jgi:uncharacterized protein YbaR (Trm112 family)
VEIGVKMAVSGELLKILACPKCKGNIKKQGMFITCNKCKLAYPILDKDIPDMLIDDAWGMDKAKSAKFKHNLKI